MLKKSPDFLAGLVMFLLLWCATTASALDYKEISVDDLAKNRSVYIEKPPKNGFIIKGVITNKSPDGYLEIDKKINVRMHGNNICGKDHKCSFKGEQYNIDDVRKRASDNRTITIYVNHYQGLVGLYKGRWYLYADKIEGLMTTEEAATYEAEKEAEAEAKRLAAAEADKYDPSKFTIVPSNFKPSSYKSIDLFTAVANAKNIPNSMSALSDYYKLNHTVTFDYVSEVVFVSQNGTDILFRTNDNAISQNMNANARSGLTQGQKVRLYYRISGGFYTLAEWRVVAIERL